MVCGRAKSTHTSCDDQRNPACFGSPIAGPSPAEPLLTSSPQTLNRTNPRAAEGDHHGGMGRPTRRILHALVGLLAAGALIVIIRPGSADAARGSGPTSTTSAVWPVDPHPVAAPFDPPACLFCAGHRGVDLASMPLAPVRAAIAGTITFAGDVAGRGVIAIDDGARRVTYEPVLALVRSGDAVRPGEVVGTLETLGSHCFPDACLHLGLIDDAGQEYLDPLTLFATYGPVRLLPLWTDRPFAVALGRLLLAL